MRKELNAMDEETFRLFIATHSAHCERPELPGASSHTVDILRNEAHSLPGTGISFCDERKLCLFIMRRKA